MTIDELIALARARLAHLNNQMASATAAGDASAMAVLERSIAETEDTIARLIEIA
jgi:N-acetylglucosamine kinase-like BadF-type ATPase